MRLDAKVFDAFYDVFSSEKKYFKIGQKVNLSHVFRTGDAENYNDDYCYRFKCEHYRGFKVNYDTLDNDLLSIYEELNVNMYDVCSDSVFNFNNEFIIRGVGELEDWSDEYGMFIQEIYVEQVEHHYDLKLNIQDTHLLIDKRVYASIHKEDDLQKIYELDDHLLYVIKQRCSLDVIIRQYYNNIYIINNRGCDYLVSDVHHYNSFNLLGIDDTSLSIRSIESAIFYNKRDKRIYIFGDVGIYYDAFRDTVMFEIPNSEVKISLDFSIILNYQGGVLD